MQLEIFFSKIEARHNTRVSEVYKLFFIDTADTSPVFVLQRSEPRKRFGRENGLQRGTGSSG